MRGILFDGGGSDGELSSAVVPIQILQWPRPYFFVMGSSGWSGWGDDFAEDSFCWASVAVEASAEVKLAMFSVGEVSFGQPTPTGQPTIPLCFAYPVIRGRFFGFVPSVRSNQGVVWMSALVSSAIIMSTSRLKRG